MEHEIQGLEWGVSRLEQEKGVLEGVRKQTMAT